MGVDILLLDPCCFCQRLIEEYDLKCASFSFSSSAFLFLLLVLFVKLDAHITIYHGSINEVSS